MNKNIHLKIIVVLLNFSLFLQICAPLAYADVYPSQPPSSSSPQPSPSEPSSSTPPSANCGSHTNGSNWRECSGTTNLVVKQCNNGSISTIKSVKCNCENSACVIPTQEELLNAQAELNNLLYQNVTCSGGKNPGAISNGPCGGGGSFACCRCGTDGLWHKTGDNDCGAAGVGCNVGPGKYKSVGSISPGPCGDSNCCQCVNPGKWVETDPSKCGEIIPLPSPSLFPSPSPQTAQQYANNICGYQGSGTTFQLNGRWYRCSITGNAVLTTNPLTCGEDEVRGSGSQQEVCMGGQWSSHVTTPPSYYLPTGPEAEEVNYYYSSYGYYSGYTSGPEGYGVPLPNYSTTYSSYNSGYTGGPEGELSLWPKATETQTSLYLPMITKSPPLPVGLYPSTTYIEKINQQRGNTNDLMSDELKRFFNNNKYNQFFNDNRSWTQKTMEGKLQSGQSDVFENKNSQTEQWNIAKKTVEKINQNFGCGAHIWDNPANWSNSCQDAFALYSAIDLANNSSHAVNVGANVVMFLSEAIATAVTGGVAAAVSIGLATVPGSAAFNGLNSARAGDLTSTYIEEKYGIKKNSVGDSPIYDFMNPYNYSPEELEKVFSKNKDLTIDMNGNTIPVFNLPWDGKNTSVYFNNYVQNTTDRGRAWWNAGDSQFGQFVNRELENLSDQEKQKLLQDFNNYLPANIPKLASIDELNLLDQVKDQLYIFQEYIKKGTVEGVVLQEKEGINKNEFKANLAFGAATSVGGVVAGKVVKVGIGQVRKALTKQAEVQLAKSVFEKGAESVVLPAGAKIFGRNVNGEVVEVVLEKSLSGVKADDIIEVAGQAVKITPETTIIPKAGQEAAKGFAKQAVEKAPEVVNTAIKETSQESLEKTGVVVSPGAEKAVAKALQPSVELPWWKKAWNNVTKVFSKKPLEETLEEAPETVPLKTAVQRDEAVTKIAKEVKDGANELAKKTTPLPSTPKKNVFVAVKETITGWWQKATGTTKKEAVETTVQETTEKTVAKAPKPAVPVVPKKPTPPVPQAVKKPNLTESITTWWDNNAPWWLGGKKAQLDKTIKQAGDLLTNTSDLANNTSIAAKRQALKKAVQAGDEKAIKEASQNLENQANNLRRAQQAAPAPKQPTQQKQQPAPKAPVPAKPKVSISSAEGVVSNKLTGDSAHPLGDAVSNGSILPKSKYKVSAVADGVSRSAGGGKKAADLAVQQARIKSELYLEQGLNPEQALTRAVKEANNEILNQGGINAVGGATLNLHAISPDGKLLTVVNNGDSLVAVVNLDSGKVFLANQPRGVGNAVDQIMGQYNVATYLTETRLPTGTNVVISGSDQLYKLFRELNVVNSSPGSINAPGFAGVVKQSASGGASGIRKAIEAKNNFYDDLGLIIDVVKTGTASQSMKPASSPSVLSFLKPLPVLAAESGFGELMTEETEESPSSQIPEDTSNNDIAEDEIIISQKVSFLEKLISKFKAQTNKSYLLDPVAYKILGQRADIEAASKEIDLETMSNEEVVSFLVSQFQAEPTPSASLSQIGNQYLLTTGLDGQVLAKLPYGKYKVKPVKIEGLNITAPTEITYSTSAKQWLLALGLYEGNGKIKNINDKNTLSFVKPALAQEENKTAGDYNQYFAVVLYNDKDADGVWDTNESEVQWAGVKVVLEKETSEENYHFLEGWNYISFPLQPESVKTASDLMLDVAKSGCYVTTVSYWQDGKWQEYVQRGAEKYGSDFEIKPGLAYLLRNHQECDWYLAGKALVKPVELSLKTGWNGIGIASDQYQASSLIEAINTKDCKETSCQITPETEKVDTVTYWHSGTWEVFVKRLENQGVKDYGQDFLIQRNQGYMIRSKQEFKWQP